MAKKMKKQNLKADVKPVRAWILIRDGALDLDYVTKTRSRMLFWKKCGFTFQEVTITPRVKK